MTNSTSFAGIQNLSAALADLVAGVAPSIVAIRSDCARSSGFVWRLGLIVTADEALSEENKFIVTLPDGNAVTAQPVGRDPTTDIALLRVEADVRPLSLAGSTVTTARSLWQSAPRMIHLLLPSASYLVQAGPGGRCAEERSTLGSNSICVCGNALRAALC